MIIIMIIMFIYIVLCPVKYSLTEVYNVSIKIHIKIKHLGQKKN